jgi:8-oxo-dGTP pyrophosphatase MutT (NUDIX family)
MEPFCSSGEFESPLTAILHEVLSDLGQNPYPGVPNPPNCEKRASVALITRIRPGYLHWPGPSECKVDQSVPVVQQLNEFFSQEWVRYGDPEVLFIKRASRAGDRWTGHVALPGGKREPKDKDDKTAAIRETSEEIGLDLGPDNCIDVGNLPERLVTTSWGTVPCVNYQRSCLSDALD